MTALLRRLTIERTALMVLFVLLFAMASRAAVDPDMWWHIRLGQQSLATGEVVYADTFSYTHAGIVHKNHSGLAQMIMAVLWDYGGHGGMTLFVAALASAGMAFVYAASCGNTYLRAFVLVAGAACAAAFWSPRPQMFTFLFAAMFMHLLRRHRRGERTPVWILPILLWLWANLHGGYLIGFVFIALFLLGDILIRATGRGAACLTNRARRRLGATLLIALAILPLNPLGLDVFAVPFETLGIGGMRQYIQEWRSPDVAQPTTWPFLLLVALLLWSAWSSRLAFDFSEWLLVGVTLCMALYSARHLSLFAIAAAPVIAGQLDAALRRKGWTLARRDVETPARAALNLALISAVAMGVVAHFRYVTDDETVAQSLALNYPVAAIEVLKSAQLEGNIFNSYNWGGYLILNAPDYPVFIDGRTDLYRDFLPEYASAAFGGDNWKAVFEAWDINIALTETAGTLAARMEADGDWLVYHRDQLASVYVKRD